MLKQYNGLYNIDYKIQVIHAMNVIWRGASVGNALTANTFIGFSDYLPLHQSLVPHADVLELSVHLPSPPKKTPKNQQNKKEIKEIKQSMLYQFQKAKQKAKQKSLSFLMWSTGEAYDNFQIIYIEAHSTKGNFAINT